MSMHHKTEASIARRFLLAGIFAAAALFVAMIFTTGEKAAFTSSEVQFTDASQSGLAIVPASCPSSPHYDGECDTEAGAGQCSIQFSDALIEEDESSTLTWQWSPATSSFPPTYESGSITPTIGGPLGPSGSQLVSPSVTTTYQYTGTSVSFFGLIRNSFSCSATLTVTPSDSDMCLNIEGVQETVPLGYTRDSSGDCLANGNACALTPQSSPIVLGGSTQLYFTSTGYPATINPVIGSVSADGSRSTGALQNDTTFTMSVPATATSCNATVEVCAQGETVQNGMCAPAQCSARCWSCGTGANANRLYYTDYTPPLCTPATQQASICEYGCTNISSCSAACNYPGSFDASVSIEARPTLVQQGDTVVVNWHTVDAQSEQCTVTGSNGDGAGVNSTGSWAGLAEGSKDSSPITAQTIYTISCSMKDGSVLSRSATVNIAPIFEEQ